MAVLVGDDGIDCDAIAKHMKGSTDKLPIVFLTARIGGRCNYAEHSMPTGEPETLLSLVRSLLGDARKQDTPLPK
jgi:hypothetical protein